jgi:hypothetical protein
MDLKNLIVSTAAVNGDSLKKIEIARKELTNRRKQ